MVSPSLLLDGWGFTQSEVAYPHMQALVFLPYEPAYFTMIVHHSPALSRVTCFFHDCEASTHQPAVGPQKTRIIYHEFGLFFTTNHAFHPAVGHGEAMVPIWRRLSWLRVTRMAMAGCHPGIPCGEPSLGAVGPSWAGDD